MSIFRDKQHFPAAPALDSQSVAVATGLYLFVIASQSFWDTAWQRLGNKPATIAALAAGIACLLIVLCVALSWKSAMKPLLAALLVAVAITSWVFSTDATAGTLATRILFFAVLPGALLLRVRITHRPFFWQLRGNLAIAVPALVVGLVIAGLYMKDYVSIFREEAMLAQLSVRPHP